MTDPQMLQDFYYEPPVYNVFCGHCIRFFRKRNNRFYYATSVPHINPDHTDFDRGLSEALSISIKNGLPFSRFLRRLHYRAHLFTREALAITNEYAVHAVVERETGLHCTMRSVLSGHILATNHGMRRTVLRGMVTELHILQHLRHSNITRLLSVTYDDYFIRFELFYEACLPLVYYVREIAFVQRPDAANVFENVQIPRYIVKCAANVMSHLYSYSITLGAVNLAHSVYIDLKGIPKLGNFQTSRYSRHNSDYDMELVSLGGFLLGMMNRTLLPEHVHAIVAQLSLYKAEQFLEAYAKTVSAFNTTPPAMVPVGSNDDFDIIRRCIVGLPSYNNVANDLELGGVPDMSGELSRLVHHQAVLFREPRLTLDHLGGLGESLNVRQSSRYTHLFLTLRIELNKQFHTVIPFKVGINVDVKRLITLIVQALVAYDDENLVDSDDSFDANSAHSPEESVHSEDEGHGSVHSNDSVLNAAVPSDDEDFEPPAQVQVQVPSDDEDFEPPVEHAGHLAPPANNHVPSDDEDFVPPQAAPAPAPIEQPEVVAPPPYVHSPVPSDDEDFVPLVPPGEAPGEAPVEKLVIEDWLMNISKINDPNTSIEKYDYPPHSFDKKIPNYDKYNEDGDEGVGNDDDEHQPTAKEVALAIRKGVIQERHPFGRFPFSPRDMIILYPLILGLYNKVIHCADELPLYTHPWTFLPAFQRRVMMHDSPARITIECIAGRRREQEQLLEPEQYFGMLEPGDPGHHLDKFGNPVPEPNADDNENK